MEGPYGSCGETVQYLYIVSLLCLLPSAEEPVPPSGQIICETGSCLLGNKQGRQSPNSYLTSLQQLVRAVHGYRGLIVQEENVKKKITLKVETVAKVS